ncbi:MAG: NFACT family protein [Firmicutes bacterium]|nr:NFACT family protein [Bacillota bacterium]
MNSRLQKIFQPSEMDFVFRFRLTGENYLLYISLEAGKQRIHPIPQKFSRSVEPSAFCMMLRKHLENSRIMYVNQTGTDRILSLTADSHMEPEGFVERTLHIELTGKTSNIILCDGKDKIIGAFNRKDHRRDLTTGQPYEAPPLPQGINPHLMEKKDFMNLLDSLKNAEKAVKDLVFGMFTGMTGDYIREILFHSGIGAGTSVKNLSVRQKETLWQSFFRFFERIREQEFQPVVYYKKEDLNMEEDPDRMTLWDFDIYSDRPKEFLPSVGEALQALYFPETANRKIDDIQKELLVSLQKRIVKVQKRIEKQEEDLETARNQEKLKKWGELILANIDKIPEKITGIELEDYYQDPPGKILIRLDPSLSPAENAQEYFKQYKKSKRGVTALEERIKISQDELNQLEGYKNDIDRLGTLHDAEYLAEMFEMEGIINIQALPGKKGAAAPSEPRKFDLAPGYVALVGRNSKQNDEIVVSIGAKEDLWFHARGMPGSHVLVKIQKPSKPVPDQVINRAASLAAYYSKGRNSGKVPVSFTRLKNVRKVKGLASGQVFITDEKTIMVKPEA